MTTVAAVDLGAESGRVLSVELAADGLELSEWHRFPTPVHRDESGTLRWGLAELQRHIAQGLAALGEHTTVGSAGVDTWGIDFGLLDEDGKLLGDPVSHRDGRTAGMLTEADRRVGRLRLYQDTGSQLLEVNSVYQLLAMQLAGDPTLGRARLLLMVPDLLHRAMSGVAVCEYTDATTTGFWDVRRRAWAVELLDDLGIPRQFLGEVVAPGTVDGELLPPFASAPGLQGTLVVRPSSHDTASAVVAVPFTDPRAAYISSGTWSLVGVETPDPVVTEASLAANLTNEGGYAGRIRLLRNVVGLWVLQECRRQWRRDGSDLTYERIVAEAEAAEPWRSIVDPDAPEFITPGDMPARLRDFCRRTGQPEPDTVGRVARCVLESLALRYRATFEDLARVTGTRVPVVHVVGGGSRNRLLCQLTADVAGIEVLAGPVEATALGNALVQLIALGEVGDLDEARTIVRAGAELVRSTPRPDAAADDAYGRFRKLDAVQAQKPQPPHDPSGIPTAEEASA
jgi:rhamnulokinase